MHEKSMRNLKLSKEERLWLFESCGPRVHSISYLFLFKITRLLRFIFKFIPALFYRPNITLVLHGEYFYIDCNQKRELKCYKLITDRSCTPEIIKSHKLEFLDYIYLIKFSMQNHFYDPMKIKRAITAVNLCSKADWQIRDFDRVYVAHDGGSLLQKFVAVWCRHHSIGTIRMLRLKLENYSTLFDKTATVGYVEPALTNSFCLELQNNASMKKLSAPLFIGNPLGHFLFGIEYRMVTYLIKRKLRKRTFYHKPHPQVPLWKVKIFTMFFGKSCLIGGEEDLDHVKIPLLVTTYTSTLCSSSNVRRVIYL